MSSSSSSSSSSHHADSTSSYSGKWEYDVFLCFRGADTRHGFTSHLMAALSDRQIKVFIDDMLSKTESIHELISVLSKSALSIVIFSKNFADSSWCLDEVATISQRMVKFGHRVLPVFYKLEPSAVSDDSGSYAAAIEQKHGSKSPGDKKRWMDALKAVAERAGHTSQAIKIDSELVEAIVIDVLKRLAEISRRVKFDHLIGMDARVCEVEQLLAMDVDDFRIIGLWGMGGVGKTTLATACYQSFVSSGKEIKHHFVQNISEKLEKQSGIEGMVYELYSILLSEANLNYMDICHRRERLSRLRVFLVLDSVETISQLEQLLLGNILDSTNLFGPGSRIILTTRDRRVLVNAGAQIYEVKCLHSHESLQLFGIHAFRQCLPPNDFVDLSNVAVSYCKGSPLAIKVLGRALLDREKSYWESFLSELGENPKLEIRDVLRRSYDRLEVPEKRVFLDIACFLPRILNSLVINYFSTRYVEDLIDKSLLTCAFDKEDKRIEVHELLREMAWDIVSEEEHRSRFNKFDDVHKLLAVEKVKTSRRFSYLNILKPKEKHRSAFEKGSATEGILLNLSKDTDVHMEANAFEGMTSLRYLEFSYLENKYGASKVHLPHGGLITLPNSLRWLEWQKFPSKSLPSRFSPENLVTLCLSGSLILKRCWEAEQQLVNLVWLDLSGCINLVAIPNLSGSPKLERLLLEGCKRLIELSSHVQDLHKLVVLDLDDCTNMRIFPAKLNSKFLKKVYLSNCPKVTLCPEINSQELMWLDLRDTPIIALPTAIYNVKQDGWLLLCGKHITCFPAISASLKRFRLCHTLIAEMDCYDDHQLSSLPRFFLLELVGNPKLKSLSRHIWNMFSGTFHLEDCPSIQSLPEISQPVTGLTQIYIKGCRNLKSFPTSINNLKSLQILRFFETDIESLPPAIVELDQLSELFLHSNKRLEFVPSNIHKLVRLSYLSLAGCSRIKFLPELPPNLLTLAVSGCTSLQALPINIHRLGWKRLYFEDCPQLDTHLPQELVLNFCNHASSNLHSQGVLQHSGSKIPGWVAHKSMNYASDSCTMVQLTLPNCTTKKLIKGIAFGVVCSSDVGRVGISITCDCSIGTSTVAAASWSSPSFGLGRASQSDNVYIWYDKNLLGETKKGIRDEAEAWYERYAGLTVSFIFSLQPDEEEDVDKVKSIKVKSIGVSLLN
ncbi:unnamed protein product [Linum tenue]|uniref:TIR domain-containing protein n=1 Tax=Linum tenue TaxID=586396 RepID=A0AAV0GNF6_9ROSI|nr:unnamed protein product [Linum tenue]